MYHNDMLNVSVLGLKLSSKTWLMRASHFTKGASNTATYLCGSLILEQAPAGKLNKPDYSVTTLCNFK